MHSAYSVVAVGAPTRAASNAAPFFHAHLRKTSFASLEFCIESWPLSETMQSPCSTPARWTQPSTSSHVSKVHTSPSSHSVSTPPVQTPAVHFSPLVQASPSSQALLFGSSVVQLSAPSLQDSAQLPSPSGPGHGSPAWVEQAPLPLQLSAPLQNRLSLQVVLGPANELAGHEELAPVHFSSTSQLS